MILGLYQSASVAGDLDQGLEIVAEALGAAADAGVDMLVMPELFLPGYGAPARAFAGTVQVVDRVADLCAQHRTGLTIGLAEWEGDLLYNAAYAFGADGKHLARYRKIQLFGPREQALFTPGDTYCVFDYGGRRFGVLICYDIEFPEHARALVRQGAEVILVPTANMMPYVNVNQILVPSRAAENATTIVYANYCGADGALEYVGLSGIFGPDGYPLAAKGTNPGLCLAALPDGWREHDIPASTQIADLRAP